MTRLRKQKTSIASLSVLFAVAATGVATAKPLAASLQISPSLTPVLGTLTFPPPTNVPVGTSIRIGGSSSMETINQVLKRRFEQQFVGTEVQLNTQGTGPAIKDLLDGNADLAAIGRSLTEQEKAQGLIAVPVSRHKIAVIVGSENPFKGDLTFEQFAKIFRGELKDWSQLGGEPGPIRFIDRPDNSDTRQAFRNYAVFKQAPFVTGKTARQLAQDNTSQVVEALKTSGIGYAIADQLQGRGDVRVITMNKVSPNNPKYPFSQPLIYVYKGPQPNPSAQAFLGFAAAPASRKTIETARKEASAAIVTTADVSPRPQVTIPSPPAVSLPAPQTVAPAPSNTDTSTAANNAMPWWWWLGLPLLGGLWWLVQSREAQFESEDIESEDIEPAETMLPPYEPVTTEGAIAPAVPAVAAPLLEAARSAGNSRLILVPRNCTNAYAYWEIPADAAVALQQQGAQKLVLRLYDVTGVDIQHQPPVSLQEFDCEAQAQDRHLPIQTDNRDYLAELGYVTSDGRWLQVARSEPVRVPACEPLPEAIVPDAETIVPAPTQAQPPMLFDDAIKIGGAALAGGAVLADDRSSFPLSSNSTVIADDHSSNATVNHWDTVQSGSVTLATFGTASLEATHSATATSVFSGEAAHGMERDRTLDSQPISQSQVFLVPRDAQNAYIYWNVSQADKDALKHQGGQQLVLQVYEAADTASVSASSVQQFLCNEWEREQHVPIPVSNLDYVAELGYVTLDGRFLKLARSPHTRVPGS
ncbi:MAG: DUF4912 domain-containing protein [Tildeniella nuda ZEHNDER 1965/U140]|jgi:phosphate transport system substrate-binding protein|nr:DUF4912 domain-containing protein [Tildeniella nuda ZEHNDER 1965/U140]